MRHLYSTSITSLSRLLRIAGWLGWLFNLYIAAAIALNQDARKENIMSTIRSNLYVILSALLICALLGCKPSIQDKDENVRRSIVDTLTDQALLAKVAMEDNNDIVHEAAIKKLTDQVLLAEVAIEIEDPTAVDKLTDPSVLVKIALESGNPEAREAAVKKLTNPDMLVKIAVENKDRIAQSLYKLIRACDSIPKEHNKRLVAMISPVIRVLNYPEVVDIAGEIISIETSWHYTSAVYSAGVEKTITKQGECFNCSIALKKLTMPLSHSWSTEFEPITHSSGFRSALVDAGDLLEPILARSSQTLVAKIAVENNDRDVREAAFKQLTDQALLAKLAIEEENSREFKSILDKLAPQTLLTNIYVSDKDQWVRVAAVDKLTDQVLLAKLAIKDESGIVRSRAQRRLDFLRNASQK